VGFAAENAILQWEEGFRRLEAARSDPSLYRALGRAVVTAEDELRKRLGSTFSVEELVAVYREDPEWGLEVLIDSLPDDNRVWDSSTVMDAAFYLYMREASDFAGGSARASLR
jgi:hypothetical protein